MKKFMKTDWQNWIIKDKIPTNQRWTPKVMICVKSY